MKLLLRIIKYVIGTFFLMGTLGGVLSLFMSNSSQNKSMTIFVVFFSTVVTFICFRPTRTKDNAYSDPSNNTQQPRKRHKLITIRGTMTSGLGIAEGIITTVNFNEYDIELNAGTTQFTLNYSKITDMQVTTDVEIQKHYVSSVAGAIGGAVLFGPLGAMIGGRVKEKKTKKVAYYFVVSYFNKDNILDYISLRLDMTQTPKAYNAINENRYKFSNVKIEL